MEIKKKLDLMRIGKHLQVHRQSMGQRVKIKKKYHNQNTKVEIN